MCSDMLMSHDMIRIDYIKSWISWFWIPFRLGIYDWLMIGRYEIQISISVLLNWIYREAIDLKYVTDDYVAEKFTLQWIENN